MTYSGKVELRIYFDLGETSDDDIYELVKEALKNKLAHVEVWIKK